MSNNKSPCIDGFTPKFYTFFWNDVKYFLLRSINSTFKRGNISISQRRRLISCNPKPNKLRPIVVLSEKFAASFTVVCRLYNRIRYYSKSFQKNTSRYNLKNTKQIYQEFITNLLDDLIQSLLK